MRDPLLEPMIEPVPAALMSPRDELHIRAAELAQWIADRIARLEPEHRLLADVDRLRRLLVELSAETEGT